RALREHSMAPRRAQIGRILRDAIGKGELQRDIDSDLAMDLLIGPIIHRRLVNEEKVPADLPERVVTYFWHVFGRGKP
ncbi:MAG TPA: TetR-like C-terminal domain-containing protein, partial [Bryobacteraceae bacterium]|nr:TetR-like C-terminal domain-containing protein [Bryobacteraceae bacterium]